MLNQLNQLCNTGFVIGNGVSRLNVDLTKLVGTTYGCNAIYRDFIPDYLIAVDSKMIFELDAAGVQYKTSVWTNYRDQYSKLDGFNYYEKSLGWSSGPTALHMACNRGHDVIYIIGFDYLGINKNTKFNNVYAGTDNYRSLTDPPTYYGNWYQQTESIIRDNPSQRFIRIVDGDSLITDWKKYKNYTCVNY